VTLAGGTLDVTLDTGDVIQIGAFGPVNSASGTYIVGAGDNSADLDSTGIVLNGGTLRDAAGNNAIVALPATTIADGSAIVVDTTAPTVEIIAPNDGDYKGGTFDITGTAADGGSGVASTEIRVQNASNDKYWNGGTNWVAGETWINTGGTNTWSVSFSSNLDDTTYHIYARATDNAGNTTAVADYDDIDVLGDVSEPTSAITSPADGATLLVPPVIIALV
ncbi:MAG: Ig-like domain-containing protein, partial [Bacteroidota bacterium]